MLTAAESLVFKKRNLKMVTRTTARTLHSAHVAEYETVSTPAGEIIKRSLACNPELQEAQSKLRDLETRRAVIEAGYGQVKAATGDADLAALSDKILDGDNLESQAANFSRRDSSIQRLQRRSTWRLLARET